MQDDPGSIDSHRIHETPPPAPIIGDHLENTDANFYRRERPELAPVHEESEDMIRYTDTYKEEVLPGTGGAPIIFQSNDEAEPIVAESGGITRHQRNHSNPVRPLHLQDESAATEGVGNTIFGQEQTV